MTPSRRALLFVVVSLLLHLGAFLALWVVSAAPQAFATNQLTEIELGVTDQELGGEPAPAPAPPPAQQAIQRPAAKRAPAPLPAPAVTLPADASTPDPDGGAVVDAGPADAGEQGVLAGVDGGADALLSGDGLFAGATGDGAGMGEGGDGTGGPRGATIALNVDLDRVRASALLLETDALLDVIPEWQLLLKGSGLAPVRDLSRVFVATPNLERRSVVLSARLRGGHAAAERAAAALAVERGRQATFEQRRGVRVAPWWNRGPTQRVVALLQGDQLLIAREQDLKRALAVERALGKARLREGFSADELARYGGLLAMQEDEAVALWVEGARRYAPADLIGVPASLRMTVRRIDQFYCELRATGRYESPEVAAESLAAVDGMRKQWLTHARVLFLGLASALQAATLEQDGQSLSLRVRLTLHQTRYLLAYVSKALAPR